MCERSQRSCVRESVQKNFRKTVKDISDRYVFCVNTKRKHHKDTCRCAAGRATRFAQSSEKLTHLADSRLQKAVEDDINYNCK